VTVDPFAYPRNLGDAPRRPGPVDNPTSSGPEEPDNYAELMAERADQADEDDLESFIAQEELRPLSARYDVPADLMRQAEAFTDEQIRSAVRAQTLDHRYLAGNPYPAEDLARARTDANKELGISTDFADTIRQDDALARRLPTMTADPDGRWVRDALTDAATARALEETGRPVPEILTREWGRLQTAAAASPDTRVDHSLVGIATEEQARAVPATTEPNRRGRLHLPDSVHDLATRWAALSGRDGSLARAVRGPVEDKAREAAEHDARQRETARRMDDPHRREQSRGLRL
jgi:hypothetical protein